jgi:hypothetical protein
MTEDQLTSEIELRPSKLGNIVFFLICVVFVLAITTFRAPRNRVAWMIAAIFGLGAVVFIVNLIPGVSYLKLNRGGFVVRSLFRTWPLRPWSEVSEFRVATFGPGNQRVLYDFEGGPAALRKINTAIVGATNALPETYGLKAQELADLMNDWRHRNRIKE